MVLVVGGSGNLGQAICHVLRTQKIPRHVTNSQTLDVSHEFRVFAAFKAVKPKIVINCAAMTDVDGCEKDPERANEINHLGALNVARAASLYGSKLIQISTDYVFDGSKDAPYTEYDATGAAQVYGKTKEDGERAVLDLNGVVVRVQWILGYEKGNFVTWVANSLKSGTQINLSTVQKGSPASCLFLAEHILRIANASFSNGIYHLTHDEYVDRYACGLFIANCLGLKADGVLNPIGHVNFGLAKRPVNTQLVNSRYKQHFGINDKFCWKNDLSMYLCQRGL